MPDISFNEKKDYRELAYLFNEVIDSLSDEDRLAVRYIRYPIDNSNLMILLEGESNPEEKFQPWGNYTLDELKYEIKSRDTIPAYMSRFIEYYHKLLVEFSGTSYIDLLNEYFMKEIFLLNDHKANSFFNYDQPGFDCHFIKRWFVFDRDFKNVLTAIECMKHDEPVERRESVRVDQRPGQRLSGDYEVSDLLLKSKSYDFSLSGTFSWMTKVLNLNSKNIYDYEKEIILMKLEMLDELAGDENFSLSTLLAYLIKLQLLIRWSSLDETAGKKFIDHISQKVKNYAYENNR